MFAFFALAFALYAPFAPPQSPPQGKTADDGVYTAAQALRGKSVVEAHCANCHGASLAGLEGPALVGSSFRLNWETKDLGALFTKIRDTMPDGAISSISDDEKLDTVAYLLEQNGFPAGDTELPRAADALKSITMARQTAGAAPRTGSLLKATGCLSEGAKNEWLLTNAEDPALANQPPLRLLNVFPNPSAHKGHKVNVSGLVMKDATGVGVNVISLEMVSASCP